jgi:hypothetical protein
MAVIAKETSYSSTSTYYTLNSVSASHSGSTLTVSINLTIQGGSRSSLDSGSGRVRYCYLYDGSGSLFNGTYTLKDVNTNWGTSFNKTWNITFTKNIGYDSWSSKCYIRIGTNTNWSSAPSPNSFWWNGSKSTNTGTVGQTFNVSVASTYVKPTVSAPTAKSVNTGSTATFSVNASGGVPASYTYQWQQSTNNGSSYSNMSGKTSSSLSLTATAAMNGYMYRCIVSNSGGSTTSNGAKLTVYYPMTLNTSFPKDVSVNSGETASFTAEISSNGNPTALTYQWYKNGSAISKATSKTYTTPTVSISNDGDKYYCKLTHTQTGTSANSRTATLSVAGFKPTIGSIQSQKVNEGSTATFSATITVGNPESTTCQWEISTDGGKTYINYGTSFTITSTSTKSTTINNTTYSTHNNQKIRLTATNTIGTTTSTAATLIINRKPNQSVFIAPAENNARTFNKTGYVLVEWGTDADGDTLTQNLIVGSNTYTAPVGIKLIQLNEANYVDLTVQAFTNDELIDSDIASRTILLTNPSWTDTITKNQTMIKAIHFTELRTKINQLEDYYGLENTVWGNEISSGGVVRAADVIEMRQALERIATLLNSYGANITLNWTDNTLTNKRIKAVHINELRTSLITL